ncbi:AMP-binding protein [bacterium]|nr:AMP-binding protein [bacterium]
MQEYTGNLFTQLTNRIKRGDSASSIKWRSNNLSWSQVEQAARKVAGGLVKLGVKPGDRVALMLPNVPPYLFIKFGVHLMGGILVPIHILTRGPELGYQLEDCEAKVLFTWSGYEEVALEGIEQTESLQHQIQIGCSNSDTCIDFNEWLSECEPFDGEPVGGDDDIALIRYTAGVTGRPKGAMITHKNLIFGSRETQRILRLSAKDRLLTTIPFYHPFGDSLQIHLALESRSDIIMLSRFDPEETYDLINHGEVDVIIGLPVHFSTLCEAAEDAEPEEKHLRFAVSGGGPLDMEVIQGFESIFDSKVASVYGTCETSPTIAVNAPHREESPRESWGRPISGMDIQIVNVQNEAVPIGEVGEIIVKGAGVFAGYWNRPGATAMTIDADGWFHTEDLGRVDLNGYLYGMGRMHDRINKGGFSVYPREIEGIIDAHPTVRISAVIGIPDAVYGEEIIAYVVPRSGQHVDTDEIIRYCMAHLARYKAPKHINIVEELPRSPNGVILRRALRESATGNLHSQPQSIEGDV